MMYLKTNELQKHVCYILLFTIESPIFVSIFATVGTLTVENNIEYNFHYIQLCWYTVFTAMTDRRYIV